MKVSEKILKQCKPAKGHVLVLKSLPASMKAYGGFQWPESGAVFAPDWKPTEECGNGLHGWLWGAGDAGLRCMDDDAKWLVLSVPSDFVDLGQKVKFPSCEIKYLGDRETAVAIIQHYAPGGTPAMFGTATAGNRGTATAGDRGTATAGDEGTATAGDEGTATAGYRGTATAGNRGTATAGDEGTATAGDEGTATAGDRGTATAGDEGVIIIHWWDIAAEKKRRKIALVDGLTILPGVKYRLNDLAEFEAVE